MFSLGKSPRCKTRISKRKIGTVSLKKLFCETALSVRLRNLETVRMLH